MNRRPSKRQLELLHAIGEGVSEWGELWQFWSTIEHNGLQFRNFDRIADALKRRGLVDDSNGVTLTDAGRAALAKGK